MHARKKLVHERQLAHASSFARVIALNYLELARATQDLFIQSTVFKAAEACQMSHFGQNRIEQSYESKR